ncbi:MAG: 30S ribosomal protein S16 [Candidatus Pacebacteria bacterium]|nr:30S ribosomal protein S16 [Candidatus Paceibacterota bacterium]
MLKIRLQRTGRKHQPTFRVVLTDSKNSTKSGRFLEVLGSHDFRRDGATSLEADRVKHWLEKGAQASGTVHNLLISQKIITGKKINVLPKKTVAKKEEEPKAEVKAEEKVETKTEEKVEETAPEETPAA